MACCVLCKKKKKIQRDRGILTKIKEVGWKRNGDITTAIIRRTQITVIIRAIIIAARTIILIATKMRSFNMADSRFYESKKEKRKLMKIIYYSKMKLMATDQLFDDIITF